MSVGRVAQLCEYTEATELYIPYGRVAQYVNYISIKLFFKRKLYVLISSNPTQVNKRTMRKRRLILIQRPHQCSHLAKESAKKPDVRTRRR